MQKTKGTTNPLALAYATTNSLVEDPHNTRAHKPPQIDAIARSIKTFGFNVPILVDGNGKVIAGHGRLAAARKLAMPEVPTNLARTFERKPAPRVHDRRQSPHRS